MFKTNNKRKFPPTSHEENNTGAKRIKLTNHSHPERSPVLHKSENGVTKSLDEIDLATAIVDSITAGHAPDSLTTKGARKKWRDEMRKEAARVQRSAQIRRSQDAVDVKPDKHALKVEAVSPSIHGRVDGDGIDARAGSVDVKMVARTRLARPVAKKWHESSGDYEAACKEASRATVQRGPSLNASRTALGPGRSRTTEAMPSSTFKAVPRHVPPPRKASPVHRYSGLKRFDDIPPPSKGPPQFDSNESSENESDSSENEDAAPNKAPVRGSVSESFADRIFNAAEDGSGGESEKMSIEGEMIGVSPRNAILVEEETEEALEDHVKVSTANECVSEAPSTSTGTPHNTSTPPTSEANAPVEKIPAVGKAGGTRSGSGHSSSRTGTLAEISSNRQRTRQEFLDTAEDSEDVYDAVDDVAEELLSESVLSMDQCKLPKPQDSACELKLDTLLTADHSARKVPASEDTVVMMVHDDGRSFDEWAIDDTEAMVTVPEAETRGEELPLPGGDVLNQISDDVAVGSSSTSLSSDLTELSRTPSPPDEDVKAEGRPRAETSANRETGSPTLSALYEPPKVVVPSRRKMTGMSSKHFSPAKRPKTRKSAKAHAATPAKGLKEVEHVDLDSPLTALQRALDQTGIQGEESARVAEIETANGSDEKVVTGGDGNSDAESKKKKKQKKPTKRKTKTVGDEASKAADLEYDPLQHDDLQTPARKTRSVAKTPTSKRRSTGKISEHFITDRVDLYNTTAGGGRVPAGVSRAPVPRINTPMFGLIQEKIWREPFWLIIAVTFLNKTAGRSAVPVFWKLKEKYPTSEALAEADQADLLEMVRHLGLQNQRSKRLIQIAKAWTAEPPVAGKRYRTLNYPDHGDGKASTTPDVVEEDAEDCAGLLEIGNIPGCGQYAYDSWRIFCRDALRNVADDYKGTNAKTPGFVPEWQRVLPDDKELRACLRWMWLREGWIWDPLTGDKRRASEEEMEKAAKGEMEIEDPLERKFAAQAAGADVSTAKKKGKRGGADRSLEETPVQMTKRSAAGEDKSLANADVEAPEAPEMQEATSATSDARTAAASEVSSSQDQALNDREGIEAPKTTSRKRGRSKKNKPYEPEGETGLRRSARHRA